MQLDPLDFIDIQPREVQVKNLFGKDYVLKEITASVAVAVDNRRFSSARLDDKGKVVGLPQFASLVPMTVGLSLFDGESPVGEDFVLALPCGIQKKLYEKLLEMSPEFEPKATRAELEKQRAQIDKALQEMDTPKG